MTCNLDSDELLAQRVEVLRSGVADSQAGTADGLISTPTRRALKTSSHFHGLLLFAAAETRDAGVTDEDTWLSAALAVDYLDAFARTHHRVLQSEQSDRRLDTGILTGDLLFSRSHELLLETDATPLTRESCVQVLTTAGRRFCEVEARRRELLQQDAVTYTTYVNVLEQFGSALSEASTKLGGILTGADGSHLEHLEAVGRNLGVALTLYATANQLAASRAVDEFADPDRGDRQPSVRTASGERSSDGGAANVVSSCIETSDHPVPEITPGTHSSSSLTCAFCHRAERHLIAASTHLEALSDTTGSRLFLALHERIQSAHRYS